MKIEIILFQIIINLFIILPIMYSSEETSHEIVEEETDAESESQSEKIEIPNLNMPFNSQSEAEELNTSISKQRVFFYKDSEHYSFADFSGTNSNINIKLYLFTNESVEDMEEKGFYIGLGFNNQMAGSDMIIVKYLTSDEWEIADYYIESSKQREVVLDTHYSDGKNNVKLLGKAWFKELDTKKFNYSNLVIIECNKDLTSLDKYDRADLLTWTNSNSKIPLISSFGYLTDHHASFDYHLVRTFINSVYLINNSNQDILDRKYNVNWKLLDTSINNINNNNGKMKGWEGKEIKYISDDVWDSLPFNNFKDAIDYKNIPKMQIYTIADNSIYHDIFMFSTVDGDETIIKGTTYLLDNTNEDIIVERGVTIGMLVGSKVMAGGDFIVFKQEGFKHNLDKIFSIYDGYATKLRPHQIFKDSDFHVLNMTSNFTGVDVSNASLYDNVKLLYGPNISPCWFRLPEGEKNTTLFGKFRNMWVFNWEKQIPEKIDYYDWKDLKVWNKNNGYLSGAFSINDPEGKTGYHRSRRAAEANFKDGSGLRIDTLELFHMTYLDSTVRKLSIISLFILLALG